MLRLPSVINGTVVKMTQPNTKSVEPRLDECIAFSCEYCLTIRDSRCSCGCPSIVECNFTGSRRNTMYLLFDHLSNCYAEVFNKNHVVLPQLTSTEIPAVTAFPAKENKRGFLPATQKHQTSLIKRKWSTTNSGKLYIISGLASLIFLVGIVFVIKIKCKKTIGKNVTIRINNFRMNSPP